MWDSLKRHWQVAKEAYRLEKDRAKAKLPIHQKDFLPAAFAVMEKPASPVGRLFFCSALPCRGRNFGKIDVVAVAPDQIVPHGQTKMVQSFEPGVVARDSCGKR